MAYRLLVDLEALYVLDLVPKSIRKRLMEHFAKLRQTPEEYLDYYERDAVGRQTFVCIFAGYSIHYWVDGANQHVKVLALKPADR